MLRMTAFEPGGRPWGGRCAGLFLSRWDERKRKPRFVKRDGKWVAKAKAKGTAKKPAKARGKVKTKARGKKRG